MQFNPDLNFRELGGYQTKDNRIIKHHIFYRSAALGLFSEEELSQVNKLGICDIYDFRSKKEVNRIPDPSLDNTNYFHLNALIDKDGNEIDLSPEGINQLSKEDFYGEEFLKVFVGRFYGNLVYSKAYKFMFDRLKENKTPILFHCMAGKDRTGVASALIMMALNCDDEIIVNDYMKTNEYRKHAIDKCLDSYKDDIEKYPGAKEILYGIEGVNKTSLLYFLNKIKEEFGSYDKYLEEVFSVSLDDRKKLIDLYTE